MALLAVQHISKQIQGNTIVSDISFEQQALQKIAVTGESGAGKTTLLKIISGHGQADSGIILFEGKKVRGSEEQLLPGHKQIGYLTQEHDLLHNYVVEDLVWFENELLKEEAMKLFEICQIDHLLKRRTDKLSGGEKQRIALCMLLIKQPKLLVLDEPFSNLDPIHTDIFKNVLDDITDRLKITCILTSHDPHDTLSWADEIIVMREGKIVQQGTPQTIYHQPVNEYVAGMFGRYNLLNAEQAALFGIEANGKNVMLRPEEFSISANEGVKGTIQKISFWGSFYEAEVLVNNVKIEVRMMRNEWKVGEEVYLTAVK
ncbi:MAG TPA: ABC transporter ATP-binding protein [Chitinophagaceae bacterium]|nr:ABC transporter ATP-binding protein [Chitinophagaceae bacterium]